jgi:hypothetical protein
MVGQTGAVESQDDFKKVANIMNKDKIVNIRRKIIAGELTEYAFAYENFSVDEETAIEKIANISPLEQTEDAEKDAKKLEIWNFATMLNNIMKSDYIDSAFLVLDELKDDKNHIEKHIEAIEYMENLQFVEIEGIDKKKLKAFQFRVKHIKNALFECIKLFKDKLTKNKEKQANSIIDSQDLIDLQKEEEQIDHQIECLEAFKKKVGERIVSPAESNNSKDVGLISPSVVEETKQNQTRLKPISTDDNMHSSLEELQKKWHKMTNLNEDDLKNLYTLYIASLEERVKKLKNDDKNTKTSKDFYVGLVDQEIEKVKEDYEKQLNVFKKI